MTVETVIDIVVSALLAATCGYCLALSIRLRALRRGQAELVELMRDFDAASHRAERNLAAMRQNGLTTGRDLSAIAARASGLVDELSVMVNAGERIAGRMEGVAREMRERGALAPQAPPGIAP